MAASALTKTYKAIKTGLKFTKDIWTYCRPNEQFDESKIPQGYDYTSLDAWSAHPDRPNKSSFTPEGVAPSIDQPANVFFIHPTSYFGKDNWNQPIGYNPAKELIDEVIMPGQASVFNGACKIYAPYYRQATFYSFLGIRKTSPRKAFEVAYKDVLEAFDHFINNYNGDRPFLIASHSQGTLMHIRLLEDRIERNDDIRSKFIASYAIGFQFPRDKFGTTFKNIHISRSATDSKCVIAYDTFSYQGGPAHSLDRIEIWYGDKWKKRANRKVVGVNPLSWNTSTLKISEKHNLGGAHVTFKGKGYSVGEWFGEKTIGLNASGISKLYPEVVSAELDEDGFLFINTPKPAIFNVSVLPGSNYHNYDYSLFYMNLRENVIERVRAYVDK